MVFFDIVYPDKGASAEHADHGGGKCSFHALIYRQIQGVADDRFSGSAEKNRESEFLQDIYMIDGDVYKRQRYSSPSGRGKTGGTHSYGL